VAILWATLSFSDKSLLFDGVVPFTIEITSFFILSKSRAIADSETARLCSIWKRVLASAY
jgi:hypothetical protein